MVAEILGRQLVVIIGKTGDLMNVWLEEETFKMLVPDTPMVKLLERKAIGQKLRKENKNIKNGKSFPKYWGQAKVTEFMFDVIEAAEAERLVKNGIKWEGKTKRVSVLRKGELEKKKTIPPKRVIVQKRREDVKKIGQQTSKAPFSFVICYNCGKRGHIMKSYTSVSRAVSKKIEKKTELTDIRKKKVKIIDENGFTKVVYT